eukprot:TRINITY_DN26551_c0_g1_i1.p1 TRINITY_DN26551_c0_g1~~TRINITY_DN26551_c0_g1_i1.p1  ORF type:complete len:339 (-),score=56.24 TRINITY_DN26551_c0_g1_i1:80-1096(-)
MTSRLAKTSSTSTGPPSPSLALASSSWSPRDLCTQRSSGLAVSSGGTPGRGGADSGPASPRQVQLASDDGKRFRYLDALLSMTGVGGHGRSSVHPATPLDSGDGVEAPGEVAAVVSDRSDKVAVATGQTPAPMPSLRRRPARWGNRSLRPLSVDVAQVKPPEGKAIAVGPDGGASRPAARRRRLSVTGRSMPRPPPQSAKYGQAAASSAGGAQGGRRVGALKGALRGAFNAAFGPVLTVQAFTTPDVADAPDVETDESSPDVLADDVCRSFETASNGSATPSSPASPVSPSESWSPMHAVLVAGRSGAPPPSPRKRAGGPASLRFSASLLGARLNSLP